MPQLFLNNFQTQFIASVKAAPDSASPALELDYGVLRVSDGAAGLLLNPGAGNWYVLTAFKRSGSAESDYEVLHVTGVDNAVLGECRLTVLRGQEGTTPKSYVAGDIVEMRLTAGGMGQYVQTADARLSNPRAPTGAAGGVLSGSYPNPGFAQAMATTADLSGKVDKVAGKGLSANDYTNADMAKLNGVAEQATKNATDAQLRDRASHSGAQAIATVTGLQEALDLKEAAGAVTAHAAAPDPHPQYTTQARASAAAPVQSVAGRTGAVVIDKADVGLGSLDNTSDASKPVSTAQQAALNLKAPLASPVFTGTPTAPTAVSTVNTTQIATTAFVQAAISAAGSPVTSVGGQTGVVLLKTINGLPLTGTGNIEAGASLYRVARTDNTQLQAGDSGKWIDITSGTFTQTLAAAATLGPGWWCYLKNSGTGDVAVQTDDLKTENMFPKDWIGPGWVLGEKSATLANSNLTLSGNVLTVGRNYVITFTVSNKSGSTIRLRANNGAVETPAISANGTYSLTVPSATSSTLAFICANALTATISNVIIEDKSPLVMYPGEMRLLICDGTNLLTTVIAGFSKVFTTSGSFIRPPGYSAFGLLAWKGGQGGQAGYTSINTSSASWRGGIGGSGSPVYRGVLPFDAFRVTVPVVVGSGGAKGVASTTSNGHGTARGVGGDTSIAGSVFSTLDWPFYIPGGVGAVPIGNSNPSVSVIPAPNAVDPVSDAGPPAGGGGSCTVLASPTNFRAGYEGSLGGWNALGARGGKGGNGASCAFMAEPPLWLEPTAGEDGQAPGGGGGGGGCGYYHSATEYRYGKDGGNGARGELRMWGII